MHTNCELYYLYCIVTYTGTFLFLMLFHHVQVTAYNFINLIVCTMYMYVYTYVCTLCAYRCTTGVYECGIPHVYRPNQNGVSCFHYIMTQCLVMEATILHVTCTCTVRIIGDKRKRERAPYLDVVNGSRVYLHVQSLCVR